MADRLLNLNIKDFLVQTLRYTLPHLVMVRNEPALVQLASMLKAQGPALLCIEHAHHVLAKLFTLDDYDAHVDYFLGLLSLEGTTRANLVKSCQLELISALTSELGLRSEPDRPKVTEDDPFFRTCFSDALACHSVPDNSST